MFDYSKGKVYRLTCDDPELVYYGSSILTLGARLIKHKSDYKMWLKDNTKPYYSSFKLFEIGGVEIELVLECPCDSKRELEEIEHTYIDNDVCVNMKGAFRTTEEFIQQRRDNNKKNYQSQEYRDYMKEYRKKHKESNKEYNRNYYLKHKAKKIKDIE